jgi:hypothetical protein
MHAFVPLLLIGLIAVAHAFQSMGPRAYRANRSLDMAKKSVSSLSDDDLKGKR